ncbi:hypothetical protein MKW94_007232 [Papaver nudicaule]|uniref:SWIM-type domain-containing protein n=1 Tax=Papaver nudicaule TaxID=74823 RepID=A0AA41VRF0_PAPNU|nr:hypothetical protein [Papaver nudicaule]
MKILHPGGYLEELVWRATKSYNEIDYTYWMNKVEEIKPDARIWLEKHHKEEWTKHKYDHTSKCEHITNNFSESFNNWILKLRCMPICKLVMEYEKLVMETMYKREQLALTWSQFGLVERAENRLKRHKEHVHLYHPVPSSQTLWLVENNEDMTWKVDLAKRECTCGAWQVGGVPCVHAMSVIIDMREDAFVDPCHFVNKYMATYAGSVEPIANPLYWLKVMTSLNL